MNARKYIIVRRTEGFRNSLLVSDIDGARRWTEFPDFAARMSEKAARQKLQDLGSEEYEDESHQMLTEEELVVLTVLSS